uniref:Uncharacterized protein n=1 Tax=Strigamia maritima TaxID=126957 RepID=T1J3Q2_STRMM
MESFPPIRSIDRSIEKDFHSLSVSPQPHQSRQSRLVVAQQQVCFLENKMSQLDAIGLNAKLEKFTYRRRKKQQKLHLISQIPGDKIIEFDALERERAAAAIQSAWRGFRARTQIYGNEGIKEYMMRHKASIVIQKWIKPRLKRKNNDRMTTQLMALDMDEENMKKEIEHEIDEWQKSYRANSKLRLRDQHWLHYQVQRELVEYYFSRETSTQQEEKQKQRQQQRHLVNQLGAEIQLASLNLKSRPQISTYSKPIEIRAKYQHETALEMARKPWRKKLMPTPAHFP